MAFRKIDSATVQRILDSANIVEVVSDFVSLKRRGSNYIGLCPFHNERTPSFSVSPAKGYCKCFSCGKGGSAVGFVMEHEQMTYNEALRYLAKKYNIEIKDHEMTDAERKEESERQNMFGVNEFAMRHFETTMSDTEDGRDIGLAYFRHRGINDAAIRRFHLGYSLERGNTLYNSAKTQGYSEEAMIRTGLIVKRDDGSIYDRFKGRVIYPWMTISGKIVAFGGRTLRSDKNVSKYVNSPESSIYKKEREVYGLYQAKKAIVEKKKCILVEGYMDVISMSQSGIENVVASSGTSLTEGQIRLIHRFTDNVTLIYDSDAAGIKASLRGIDMLLSEGLNIKVVLLPDGDDPDSFAQSHTTSEVEEYIARHETDFIRFKTSILMGDVCGDPIKRSRVISDIVRSISVIPDEITRTIYIKECSRSLDIDEKVLLQQMARFITERAEKQATDRARQRAADTIAPVVSTEEAHTADSDQKGNGNSRSSASTLTPRQKSLYQPEREIARYILKYGMVELPTSEGDGSASINVVTYISRELDYAGIALSDPAFSRLLNESKQLLAEQWESDFNEANKRFLVQREEGWSHGEQEIRATAADLQQIKALEQELLDRIDREYFEAIDDYRQLYLINKFASCPDDTLRRLANELGSSRYRLSKVHSKYTKIETECDRLVDLLPRAVYSLKDAIAGCEIRDLRDRLKELTREESSDISAIEGIMKRISELDQTRRQYAKALGERVVIPK